MNYMMYNPQLDTFICVVEAGSFSKAAEELYISAPAVIKQINSLENSLNLQLFERTHRGLIITEAGKSLYQDAKYLIQYSKESLIRAQEAMNHNEEIIRVGISPMTPPEVFVELWPKIQKIYPEMKFKLITFENTPELVGTVVLWLISKRHNQEVNSGDNGNKKLFYTEMILLIAATLFFGGRIVYSAVPYHGALSWKLDEWMRKKEVELEHNNLFEDGVEGILMDLDEALQLPEELYIANKYQVSFDENGTIQRIYAFIYGKNEAGEKKTYLIDYDADSSNDMTVWIDGNVNGEYSDDMRLSPMIEILNNSDWTSQVEAWAETFEEQQIYEILYMGRRSFSSEEGLQYISGDADGDGTETGTGNFTQLRSGGEIVGFEVSLHIPDLNSVTPVRYIMEPEYVSQQELKQENTMQQVEDAKDTESWTVDQSDGTMYFFLDENNGWRLVITDAAAGSRFYVMEKTMDGGSTWECINDDPFSGQLGVAEGLIFYDENFGVAGITGASQSYSRLYVTRDGGRAFEEMKLPMDLVSELPQIAIDCGFTVEDFDYLNMPEKEDDTLTITVTTDAAEKDGIVFQSTDYGATWEYKGLVQIAN